MLVYSLFDRQLGEHGALVLAKNDESIRRSALDGIRGTGSLVELHPEDFDLVCVGAFDTESGELSSSHYRTLGPVSLILGKEVPVGK